MFELRKNDRNATLKSVRCPEAVLLFHFQMVTFLKGKVLMVINWLCVMQFPFAAHIYFGGMFDFDMSKAPAIKN